MEHVGSQASESAESRPQITQPGSSHERVPTSSSTPLEVLRVRAFSQSFQGVAAFVANLQRGASKGDWEVVLAWFNSHVWHQQSVLHALTKLVSFFARDVQIKHEIFDVQSELRQRFLDQYQDLMSPPHRLDDSLKRHFELWLMSVRQGRDKTPQFHKFLWNAVFILIGLRAGETKIMIHESVLPDFRAGRRSAAMTVSPSENQILTTGTT
jgi:hypothetical protein